MGPLVVFSIVSMVAGFLMMPIVQHVLEVSPIPDGVTPERYQRGIAIGTMIQKVAIFLAPVAVAVIFSIQAAILLGASSVFSAGAKFRELFNLVAGCGLIQAIAAIAAIIVLKSKGEISSRAELRPALGLDIFLPEGTKQVSRGVPRILFGFRNLVDRDADADFFGGFPREQDKGSCRDPAAGAAQSPVAHGRGCIPALTLRATMGVSYQ